MSDWRYCGDGNGTYAGTYIDLDEFRNIAAMQAEVIDRAPVMPWWVGAPDDRLFIGRNGAILFRRMRPNESRALSDALNPFARKSK